MARGHSEEAQERAGVVRATQSFVHEWDGAPRQFVFGTTVRVGHPVLDGVEHLFEPFTPDYEVADVRPDFEVKGSRVTAPEYESATAGPNEKRGG